MTTLGERLRKFGDGEVDNVILSRADARYLADLVGKDTKVDASTLDDHSKFLIGDD